MRMLTERLERDGIVNLSRGLARVVQRNEVRWLERLLRDWIDVVMLSIMRA